MYLLVPEREKRERIISLYYIYTSKFLMNEQKEAPPAHFYKLKAVGFDALYLEQHIRGRSVLRDLLQTGVHKIAEIIRPGNQKEEKSNDEFLRALIVNAGESQ